MEALEQLDQPVLQELLERMEQMEPKVKQALTEPQD